MVTVPEILKDKVLYLPHDGVSCDRLVIGETVLNHVELSRLYNLLGQILAGDNSENYSN